VVNLGHELALDLQVLAVAARIVLPAPHLAAPTAEHERSTDSHSVCVWCVVCVCVCRSTRHARPPPLPPPPARHWRHHQPAEPLNTRARTHSIWRRQFLPGLLKSHAAQSSSVTMAAGCSRLVRMMLGYMAATSRW
jgi:hypothetical protein